MKKPKKYKVKFKKLVINAGTVRIESNGTPYGTEVYIDGVKQISITALHFKADAVSRAKLRLDMYIPKASVK